MHQLPIIGNATVFEDLICDLLNNEYKTILFKRFGKQGHNQKGIDIFSVEHNIAVQCKKKDLTRKESITRRELCNDIEKDVQKIISQNLKINFALLIIASTISDHPDIDEICEDIKTKYDCSFEIIFWGWETIQNKILDSKILLSKYYPNFIIQLSDTEQKFHEIQTLKKRIQKDFSPWINYSLEKRALNSDMMIRRFDDTSYPHNNNLNEFNTYNWYKAEFYQSFHNGLEFIVGIKNIIILPNGLWRLSNHQNDKDLAKVCVYVIARLNYSEILDYDIKGDKYDAFPHIFCRFKFDGSPFEKIFYEDVKKSYNIYQLENQVEK